jgi:hypothetical protein
MLTQAAVIAVDLNIAIGEGFAALVNGYDRSLGQHTTGLSFIVNRPPVEEPGFQVTRQEGNDRHIFYQLYSYATEPPW